MGGNKLVDGMTLDFNDYKGPGPDMAANWVGNPSLTCLEDGNVVVVYEKESTEVGFSGAGDVQVQHLIDPIAGESLDYELLYKGADYYGTDSTAVAQFKGTDRIIV